MRKFFTIIVYTVIILLIGRNVPQLPRFFIFTTPQRQKNLFLENLKRETYKRIQSQKANYGIYFADFNTNDAFGINHKEIFTAASVNKVPIVAVLYYLEHKGKIDLDEQITLQKEDIQDYGTGSLRYQKPGETYSLKTLAKLSLQQSDNTAAHILANRIGMPAVQKTISQWGLAQTDMENNKTSPYDMYILFKKLYKGEITSVARTQELFGFMIDTDIEDRLSANVPNGTQVYHKTGDVVGGLHDVGVIQRDGVVFFLGIMTSEIGESEQQVKNTIGTIAHDILSSYEKKDL